MSNEDLQASDEAKTSITIDVGPVKFKRVKVTGEAGIFKGGKQYNQGDEAVIEAGAAERFERVGDVEIVDDAEVPEEIAKEL